MRENGSLKQLDTPPASLDTDNMEDTNNTGNQLVEVLGTDRSPRPQHYDRGTGDDESQLIGASKIPGSEVARRKCRDSSGAYIPSWKRCSGD
jgi:hypothetical protein